MAGLKAGAPTPQALTVHEASRVLEVAFSDGAGAAAACPARLNTTRPIAQDNRFTLEIICTQLLFANFQIFG